MSSQLGGGASRRLKLAPDRDCPLAVPMTASWGARSLQHPCRLQSDTVVAGQSLERDPGKLRTFPTRSCDETSDQSEMAIRLNAISLYEDSATLGSWRCSLAAASLVPASS